MGRGALPSARLREHTRDATTRLPRGVSRLGWLATAITILNFCFAITLSTAPDPQSTMVEQTHDHQIPPLIDREVLTQNLSETQIGALACVQYDFSTFKPSMVLIRTRLFTDARGTVCYECLAREKASLANNRTMFMHTVHDLTEETRRDPSCTPRRLRWFSAVADPNSFSFERDEPAPH